MRNENGLVTENLHTRIKKYSLEYSFIIVKLEVWQNKIVKLIRFSAVFYTIYLLFLFSFVWYALIILRS